MSTKEHTYHGGVVNSVSTYRRNYFIRKYGSNTPPESDAVALDRMLREYKQKDISAERKHKLRHDILMRTFFLFPHYLKKNYYLTAELFNDAVQNMVCNTLQAIELFKPELGFPFTNYLLGYFRDAATKTLKSCNVVSTATLRQAAIDAMLPPEESESSENPYIVMGGSDDPSDGATKNEEDEDAGLDPLNEPIRKNQRIIRGAARVVGNAVELDDSREYALAPGVENEIDIDERIHNAQLVDWLEEAISEEAGILTEDERFVLIHHYGLFGNKQLKYDEIAAIRRKSGRGSACSRISQINTSGIKKIRSFFLQNGVSE